MENSTVIVEKNQTVKKASIPLTVLIITVIAHFINDTYSMLTPSLLPILKTKYGIDYFQLGILASTPLIISAALQSFSGHFAEKYAIKKIVLITGFFILGFGYTIFSQSPTYILMLISAILIGIGLSTYHPQGISILTKNYSSEQRGKILGIHGVGGSLGFLMGPFIGGVILYNWGLEGFAWIWIPAVIIALLIYKFLHVDEKPVKTSYSSIFSFQLLAVAFLASINTFFSRGVSTFMPSYFVAQGDSLFKANMFTALMLLPGLISQPLGGYLSDKLGRKIVIFSGYISASVLLYIFVLYPNAILLMLVGFFIFLTIPVRYAFVIDIAGEKAAASIGLMLTFSLTLASTAPTIIGYLIDKIGFTEAFKVVAIGGIISGILILFLKEKRK